MVYGKLRNYEVLGKTVKLQFEEKDIFVNSYDGGIIRFSTSQKNNSFAVLDDFYRTAQNISVEKKDNGLMLISGNTEISVKDNFITNIFVDKKLILEDYCGKREKSVQSPYENTAVAALEGHTVSDNESDSEESVLIMKKLGSDDAVYGLGDKPGCLNKRGYAYENWNTDDPAPHVDSFKSLYKSIPFFMVLSEEYCYGIFADNTFKTTFDFGKENEKYFYIKHEKGEMDYYFIPGKNPAEITGRYTLMTGHTKLPQKWILGYHQSRWSYFTAEETEELADNFRSRKIPCDSIHLDIDYMKGYRVFTVDEDKFPDMKDLSSKLEKQGIKLISIIDPGVKKDSEYDIYTEGIKLDAFAKDKDGKVYENAVWPGTSVFPDFTDEKVCSWWGKNVKKLLDKGIRGIWNDMNEPASFNGPLPMDVQFKAGKHEEVHNIYGHCMAQATYDGLKEYDNRRPFVLTRAAYAGSQRYCGGWTGDNHSIWSHIQLSLVQMCNLGLSGIAMCGSDIGGFGSDTTPELFVRFFQAGIFSPFFRSHSAMGTRRQEIWAFDKETEEIVRDVIKLRYRFIPYMYDLAYECDKTGAPILRPLVYEFPADKNVRNICDEYMLGSYVLAAPVIEPGKCARAVYLPEGEWYDYYTNEKISGGRYILADAPLNRVPLFIKAGAAIPMAVNEPDSVDDIKPEFTKVFVYPGKGEHTHYYDDGESFDYEKGIYKATKYTVNENNIKTEIINDNYSEKDLEIVVVK